MSPPSVAAQAAAAFDAVLHVRRYGGRRHLAEFAVVRRGAAGLVVEPVATWTGAGPVQYHSAWPELRERLEVG
jgi:pilus assembly protein CpaF